MTELTYRWAWINEDGEQETLPITAGHAERIIIEGS